MGLTTPFAQNGDKKTIPQTTSDGSVSFDRGFGSFYALPPEEGGLFIDRAQFNQLMYDTTSQVLENKQQITTQANRINEVNTTLTQSINTKANQATTYTKTEVNNLLNAKANANATVNLTGNQTIAGVKTFSSVPVSATNPTANNQVANKAYVDTVGNTAVKLTGNQTIAGVKTFSSVPVSATNPTANNQVANKAYVDTVGNTAVKLTGNQTIAGTKTFSSPVVVPNATANTHAVNLAQLNTKANQATTYTKTEVNNLLNAKANANATVNLTGNQTIAGIKTFSAVPVCATAPTANNHLANKAYVDGLNQVPDYSAGVSIIKNQTFTAQFNGVVEIYSRVGVGGGWSFSLSDGSQPIMASFLYISGEVWSAGQAIIVKGGSYIFNVKADIRKAVMYPFKSVT